MLTADRLRKIVVYNQETGEFVWRFTRTKAKAGKRAGTVKPDGYRWIGIDGRQYVDGRLAWLWMTGEWPKHSVDHKNCDPLDSRWDNLREADLSQQAANQRVRKNKEIPLKGVQRRYRRFVAWTTTKGGRSRYLGAFDTAEAANAAYLREAKRIYGEFARAF